MPVSISSLSSAPLRLNSVAPPAPGPSSALARGLRSVNNTPQTLATVTRDRMMVVAPKHLRADTEWLAANIAQWINRAVDGVAQARRGTVLGANNLASPDLYVRLVQIWFGDLDAEQFATLARNLTQMRDVLQHPQSSICLVDAPSNDSQGFYAQVRGGFNPLRPRLTIEVADLWRGAGKDDKAQTLFHELSHRILGTDELGRAEGYPATLYGRYNAMLAAEFDPRDALRNAENYGYFIAECNGLNCK